MSIIVEKIQLVSVKGYWMHGDGAYYKLSEEKLSWYDAVVACRKEGAHLSDIHPGNKNIIETRTPK